MEAFLLQNLFWVITALFAGAGLVWTFKRAGKINLSPQAAILAVSRGGGVFLDIRSAAEFSDGHIARSQNIPSEQLSQRGATIEKFKQKPLVLVCARGLTARKIVPQLIKDGFNQVYVLAGGINGWREASMPLVNKADKKKAK